MATPHRSQLSTARKALDVAADVSKVADLQASFQTAIDRFDRVDILVSAAALLVDNPIGRVTGELFDRYSRST